MTTTVIYGTRATGIPGASTDRGGLWLSFADFERATGWEWKPRGVCLGEICVPIPPRKQWIDERAGADRPRRVRGVPWAASRRGRRARRLGFRSCDVAGGTAQRRGPRLHASRSRGEHALPHRLSREKGAPLLLGLLARLPPRPAGLAGHLRGDPGQGVRHPRHRVGHRGRSRRPRVYPPRGGWRHAATDPGHHGAGTRSSRSGPACRRIRA